MTKEWVGIHRNCNGIESLHVQDHTIKLPNSTIGKMGPRKIYILGYIINHKSSKSNHDVS